MKKLGDIIDIDFAGRLIKDVVIVELRDKKYNNSFDSNYTGQMYKCKSKGHENESGGFIITEEMILS